MLMAVCWPCRARPVLEEEGNSPFKDRIWASLYLAEVKLVQQMFLGVCLMLVTELKLCA